MNRTPNLRWKRKGLAVAAVAVSFAGFAALNSGTVSASDYSQSDCSESAQMITSDGYGDCTVATDDYTSDTVTVDTDPVSTDSITTEPETTAPTNEQLPPATTSPTPSTPAAAPTAPAAAPAAAAPAQVAPAEVVAPHTLPVTGRSSALPTLFIAVGLLGAGSVALAFARRGSAARSSQS